MSIANLIEAFTNGVHWQQVLLAQTKPTPADAELFSPGNLSQNDLRLIAKTFEGLLMLPAEAIGEWISAPEKTARVAALIKQLLSHPIPSSPTRPVNAVRAQLIQRAPADENSARAVANLVQLNLEERFDGTLLQQLFHQYIQRGLKVNFSQLGLPADDDDLKMLGANCAARAAKGPHENTPAYWYMTFKRIEMWGDKNTGRRDKFFLAKELLNDPEIQSILSALEKLPPKRLAFIGWSMLSSQHWSSYAAWNDIAAEVVRLVNPTLEYANFNQGGITASRMLGLHFPRALAYRPTEAWFGLNVLDDKDSAALESMFRQLQDIGAKVNIIDENRPWIERVDPAQIDAMRRRREAAHKTGATLHEFHALGKTDPAWESWECLDTIHMTTEGHVFYAKALLKHWANGG